MHPGRLRTWLWQLSYSVLGLAFFVGLLLSIASWSTRPFYFWLSIFIGSLMLLAILSRFLNTPQPPSACPHCGYDQSGLPPNTPCPECGRAEANRTQ